MVIYLMILNPLHLRLTILKLKKKNNLFMDKGLQKYINDYFELLNIIYSKKDTTIYKVNYKKNNINKHFILKIIKKKTK